MLFFFVLLVFTFFIFVNVFYLFKINLLINVIISLSIGLVIDCSALGLIRLLFVSRSRQSEIFGPLANGEEHHDRAEQHKKDRQAENPAPVETQVT